MSVRLPVILVTACTALFAGGVSAPARAAPQDTTAILPDTLSPDTLSVPTDSTSIDTTRIKTGTAAPDTLPADDEPPDKQPVPRTPPAPLPKSEPAGKAAEAEPPSKSPFGAAVRSVVLPGWGQFYTGHRVKGVLVASAQVALAALWQVEKRSADSDFEEYERTGNEAALTRAQDTEQRADNYLSWTILVTLLSGVDAYIDAHLYRFDENLEMEEKGDEVSVTYRFY